MSIKKNIIVASQSYDVTGVQFTVVKDGPLNFCSLFKSITLGLCSKYSDNAACESLSKRKLIKTHLRSSMSTLRLRNLATLSIEQHLTDKINFDIAIEKFANKKARKVTV